MHDFPFHPRPRFIALFTVLAFPLIIATHGCAPSLAKVQAASAPPALASLSPGDELYELSPARMHIRRLAPQALRLLAPHWSHVREGDRKPLQVTLLATFSETRVTPFARLSIRQAVAARPDLAAKALEWLRSPIGYEVKFAEATAWSGEKSTEDTFSASVAEVRDNQLPEIRIERIRRLAESTGALGKTLDLTASVGTVVARLVNAARAESPPLSAGALRAAIERERRLPAVITAYAPVVDAALLVRCRDLDLQQLDSYTDFATTEAGHWYHDTLATALTSAIEQASMDVEGVFEVNARSGEPLPEVANLDALLVELPSGRSIRLLALGHAGPQTQRAVVLRYETTLPMNSAAAVGAEAAEVWEKLRGQIEAEGAHAAVLQATGSVEGWVFPFASSRKFGWQRRANGQWIALQNDRAKFGELEREMLWSSPP